MSDAIFPQPSAVEYMRHQYVRAHARRLSEASANIVSEQWLAVELDKILKGYCERLEQMVDLARDEALKAYQLAPTKPFLVKK